MTSTLAPAVERRPSRLVGLGLVLLSSMCFASGSTATKAVLAAGVAPLQVMQARVTITAAVLMAALVLVRPSALRVRRDEWPLLLGYGVLAFFAVQSLYALALSRLPVGVALLLEYLAPVLVALWVRVVRGTVLPRTTWLGAALAVGGLAVVAQVWRGFRLDVPGVAFALGAAAALASYFLLSEHSVRAERDPIGLVAWGALVAAVPLTLVNPPERFPFAALGNQVALGPWSMPALVPMLWLGLVSTVVAYVTGVAVLRHLPSQVASVLATVEVLIATVIAWALLGERLGALQLAGGAVLLAGVVVVQLRRPSRHFRPAGS